MKTARVHATLWPLVASLAVLSPLQRVAAQRAPMPGELHSSSAILRLADTRSHYAAPICDGSRVRAVEHKKRLGTGLMLGGAVGTGLMLATAVSNAGSTRSRTPVVVLALGSAAAATVGFNMRRSAGNVAAYADDDIAKFKVGETRTQDVESCLGRPSSMSSSTNGEEVWSYFGAKPGMFGIGGVSTAGSGRMLIVTFRNGVISDVRRTSSGS